MYAGASGDYNPLHTDEVYVGEATDYPTVFAHGMLTMGASGKVLTDWVGHGRLTTFGVRFLSQVWPGDTLTATATVTEIRTDESGDIHADLTVETVNQHGQPVVSGSATAQLDP